jgi:mannose-1-phosphate guanylyltransferase
MLTPVLLSGGVGSRLWPVSRETHPKQFQPLAGELSMLQQTLQRTSGMEETRPLVVCNEEHRFMVAEQLRPYRPWQKTGMRCCWYCRRIT